MPEVRYSREGALVMCGLWLHIGYIGAVVLAAGLLELGEGVPNFWTLSAAFFGAALAVASWRRARNILEPMDEHRPS